MSSSVPYKLYNFVYIAGGGANEIYQIFLIQFINAYPMQQRENEIRKINLFIQRRNKKNDREINKSKSENATMALGRLS